MPTFFLKTFKNLFKILGWTLLSLLILFVTAASFLPMWLSTDSGKKISLNLINKAIPGSLSVDNMHLSWFGGQQIEGFTLSDANAEQILSFTSFSTEGSLFSILFGKHNLGKTSLISPTLHLVELPDGQLNIYKALLHQEKTSEKKPLPVVLPKGELHIEGGEISLNSPKIDPISLTDLSVDWNQSPPFLQIKAKTSQGGVEGEISVKGKINEKTKLFAKITNLPVPLLDQLHETNIFSTAFGKTLSLDLQLESTEEKMVLSGLVDSLNLKGEFKGTTEEGRFILDPNSKLTFTVTPSFFSQILDKEQSEKWTLADKIDLSLLVEKLEFPLEWKKPNFDEMVFSGKIALDQARLVHEKTGSFSLKDFQATLHSTDTINIIYSGKIQGKGPPSDIEGEISLLPEELIVFKYHYHDFPVDLLELVTDDTTYLRYILGDSFDLTSKGTYQNKDVTAGVTLSTEKLSLQGVLEGKVGKDLSINLLGQYNLDSKIYGSTVEVQLSCQGFWEGSLFSIPLMDAHLKTDYWESEIHGKLGEKGKPFAYDQVRLVATGSLFQLPLPEEEFSKDLTVNDGTFSLNLDGAKNLLQGRATLSTDISTLEETRTLEASFEAKNFIHDDKLDYLNAEAWAKGDLAKFPIALLNPFLGEHVNLTPFFGPSMDLHFDATYHPDHEHRLNIDLTAQATGFQAFLSLALNDTLSVKQNKPAYIHWEITPVRYLALMKLFHPEQEPGFVLTQNTPIDLRITQFICPTSETSPTVSQFLCQSGFVGDLQFGKLVFKNYKTEEKLTIEKMQAAIQGEDFSQTIGIKADGDIAPTTLRTSQPSGFSFDGEMLHLWSPEGKFNRKDLTVKGDLSLDLVPVREITGVFPMQEETRKTIRAVLGPLVNARIYGEISQLSGPLTIDIKSTNFKTIIPAELKQGNLTLRKTVEAELTLTEEVNETLLKDINPLVITGAWSDNPLRFYIDAEGFSVPLFPFSIRTATVERAVVDIGKINVKNGGEIQTLMDFLKAKKVSPEGIMEAWFTPIFVSLKDGTARYKRFDALLAGNVHIAMWGRIDLVKDKVKMTLGISPATLYKKLKIVGLAKEDMFQVKMRGSTSDLDLDWSSAYTRIGIIMTRTAGGLGYILGGLIEQIVTALGEEPTPPPTTTPFPWQSNASHEQNREIPKETPLPSKSHRKHPSKR